MKVRTRKLPVTVPLKTGHFARTVSTSMVETLSVTSFVSVQSDESHDTPETSTEAAVSGSCGNAEIGHLSPSATHNPKVKSSKLTDYQLDQTIQLVVKRDNNHQAGV